MCNKTGSLFFPQEKSSKAPLFNKPIRRRPSNTCIVIRRYSLHYRQYIGLISQNGCISFLLFVISRLFVFFLWMVLLCCGYYYKCSAFYYFIRSLYWKERFRKSNASHGDDQPHNYAIAGWLAGWMNDCCSDILDGGTSHQYPLKCLKVDALTL